MAKKFQNISYDLSQNIIFQVEMSRLDYHSLILTIVHFLKESSSLLEFLDISYEGDTFLDDEVQNLIDESIVNIYNKIKDFDPSLELMVCYIRNTIFIVLEQLYNFIKIAKVYLLEDKIIIIKHLVFTSQGTVNTRKTLLRVFESRNWLSPFRKFKLAAQFFLEEIVYESFLELSEFELLFILNIKFEEDFAQYFWIRKCTHFFDIERRKLYKKSFVKAVEEHNEMAVYYLWVNHISNIRKKIFIQHLILNYLSNFSHENIIMYLILEAERDIMEEFFDEIGYRFQLITYESLRWRVAFTKILRVLKVHIDYNKYVDILSAIDDLNHCKKSSAVDLIHLKEIITQMPEKQGELLEKLDDDTIDLVLNLVRALFEGDVSCLNYFFFPFTKDSLFNFLISDYGRDFLQISIKNYNLRYIDIYLREKRSFSEDDMSEIKTSFFKLNCYRMYSDCLLFNKHDILNEFTVWLSDSIDGIFMIKFHSNLFFKHGGILVKQLLFQYNQEYNPLEYIDQVLKIFSEVNDAEYIKSLISLHTDEENINDFRIKCYANVRKLIYDSEWDYLLMIIAWKPCTLEEIDTLGKKLLNDAFLFKKMLEKNGDLNYFLKFLSFICTSLNIDDSCDEFYVFKARILNGRKLFLPLIKNWNFGNIALIIIGFNLPIYQSRSFLSFVMKKFMSRREPNTDDLRLKFEKFKRWVRSIYGV